MSTTTFVDTSAWYAVLSSRDRHHTRASELLQEEVRLCTSDHVLVETWLLVNHRSNYVTANRFIDGIRSADVAVEHTTSVDLERAVLIGATFPDQTFSLVDRTSFAVMERLGIDRAASFDDDFLVYRYGPRRDRAFTVLR